MGQKLLGRFMLLLSVLAVVLTVNFSETFAAEKPNIDKPVKALEQTETAVEALIILKRRKLFKKINYGGQKINKLLKKNHMTWQDKLIGKLLKYRLEF